MREGELMRLMGLASVMAIALVATAIPTLAQGNRAAERAAARAQYAVQDVDQVIKETQSVERDANQATVQAEEKGEENSPQSGAPTKVPESGGISIGNVVILALGGSVLVAGTWLLARRALR